ncbi:hypothetical protein OS493_040551 [Desmophyllum pertusum]|uniref:Protein kinase domain-containing protein n=1 Tax=Desmophyllum pertusum TaxID=174260 RepID=A0A9W9YTS4_9CNID|nr:hypothetical protein OS493_040551 [Desmophyllum pertusum]
MLKQLEHKHIVAFYGVAMNVHSHKLLSLSLVFDVCTDSLKNHIFKDDNCIPWKNGERSGRHNPMDQADLRCTGVPSQ